MHIQVEFFEGTLEEIQSQFNKWSKGKFIKEATFHARKDNNHILKVIYGI